MHLRRHRSRIVFGIPGWLGLSRKNAGAARPSAHSSAIPLRGGNSIVRPEYRQLSKCRTVELWLALFRPALKGGNQIAVREAGPDQRSIERSGRARGTGDREEVRVKAACIVSLGVALSVAHAATLKPEALKAWE